MNAKRRKWEIIIAALRHKPLPVTTISERIGWSRTATESTVWRMYLAGVLDRQECPTGYRYALPDQPEAGNAPAARITPYKGQKAPSRTPPEWKPLRRDPYRIMKLAMLTR